MPAELAPTLSWMSVQRHTHQVRRSGDRLTVERVSRVIAAIGKEAKIVVRQPDKEKGVRIQYASAHDLRRGCAVRLINAGISAETLQVVMRHEDFATTQKFCGATKQAQAERQRFMRNWPPQGQEEGFVGGLSSPLNLTLEQQNMLKALLESI